MPTVQRTGSGQGFVARLKRGERLTPTHAAMGEEVRTLVDEVRDDGGESFRLSSARDVRLVVGAEGSARVK